MIDSNQTVVDATPAIRATAEEKRTDGRGLPLFASGVAFFVSYVLSAGPAVFITRRFDQPWVTTMVECLYSPLIYVVKARVPFVSTVIEAYVRLFR